MQNLVQLGERRRKLCLPSSNSDRVVDICHVETDEMASGSSTVVLTQDGTLARMAESGDVAWTCDLETVQPGGGWFDLSYVDPELVCLSRHGAVVSVNPINGEAEVVGVFDHGLEAAAWSPDKEVLLMVTSTTDDEDDSKVNSVLMSMNAQFEVLAEITIPSFVPSSTPEAGVHVAWRPDGTLCAVSCVDALEKTRNVKMYKRETLEVHAIGRAEDASGAPVKNLQDSGVAWASPGCSQLLAAVQRKGKKTQQVVFFESNGLRHREFVLREAPSTIVTSLAWNVNSDLLAVSLREEGNTDKIQLWHRCNYHWYLKREIRFVGQTTGQVKFDEEQPSLFYVMLESLEWREYNVCWDPSTTSTVNGECPAVVIDGCSLNITRLDRALIPPPLFMSALQADQPIREATFCGGTHSGTILLHLSDGSLDFFSGEKASATKGTKISWTDSSELDFTALRSFLAVGEQDDQLRLIAISPAETNKEAETLVEMRIVGVGTQEMKAEVVSRIKLEDRVMRVVNWADSASGCLLELIDGSFLEYDLSEGSGTVVPSDTEPLLEPCPWIAAVKDASVYNEDFQDLGHSQLVFGLSSKSRLYFHDMMLTETASSFYLSCQHEFLCFATAGSRCTLRFLPLREVNSFDPLMGMEQNNLLDGYEPRSVERGARLVAILPSQPTAILQMPRGNLEGIYPRALVLRFAMTKIRDGQFGEAFSLMRKHKVDLNLLVDFDPVSFLETGLTAFLGQVNVIDHLNLFISGLQDWDTTQAKFPVPTWLSKTSATMEERSTFDFTTKVNQICRKARETMLAMEETDARRKGYFLLPVLSTFAKESPPRLDEALNLIKDNALEQHQPTSKKPPLFADNAQQSIHYLAFLAEYELLFETALGMYDYDVARAVARNSQMDPKVYLPLLKRLVSLPPFYAKYEVDIRLKRYEAALENLVQSHSAKEDIAGFQLDEVSNERFGNSFDDCIALVDQHKLYQSGLRLFNNDLGQTRTILSLLGESLLKERKPHVALSVFLRAEPPFLEGAKRASREAGEWRTFFSLLDNETSTEEVTSAELRMERRRQIAREVAEEMVVAGPSNSKREVHSDAARILVDYGDDLLGAVDTLIDAQCWNEGHRIGARQSREDLLKRCSDGAVSYAQTALDEFVEKETSFVEQNSKYAESLVLRKKLITEEGPEPTEADETGSLFSVASAMSLRSNASTSSTGTSVSSVISVKSNNTFSMTGDDEANRHRSKFNKGKKKKQRKKQWKPRRRPGSEEELKGIVSVLKDSCPDKDYADTIAETIQYLVFVQQPLLAAEVFQGFQTLREGVSKSQTERTERASREKAEAERNIRLEGEGNHEHEHLLVELPIETEMDILLCPALPDSVTEFFSYLDA